MTTNRVLTKTEQRAMFDAVAPLTIDLLLGELEAKRDYLLALARTRAFGPLGDEYGDATFRKSTDEILDECDAELADAIFYAAVSIQQPVARILLNAESEAS